MKDQKPWYEKIYIWIGIIAGICTILAFVITLYTIANDDTKESINTMEDNNDIPNNVQVIGDGNKTFNGIFYGDININENEQSETKISSESSTAKSEIENQFNLGQAMQHIYSNEETIQNEIINNKNNKPINSSIYPGVSYWYISDKVRLIIVINGFRDNECSRTYYFDEDEKLTFSLIKDDKGEHRLYFYDDILIRYIDENGLHHDIEQDLDNLECKWTELSLEESYEIFSGVKNPSNSSNDIPLYPEESESIIQRYADDYVINWEDKTFERLMQECLGKTQIVYGDIKDITSLQLYYDKILINQNEIEDQATRLMKTNNTISLNDLQYFSSLLRLSIHNFQSIDCNIFSDDEFANRLYILEIYNELNSNQIMTLANFDNLVGLVIVKNNIGFEELCAISSLENLNELILWNDNIADISPITNLNQLIYLDLSDNKISNIDILNEMKILETVILCGNNIIDYSPVSHVKNVIKTPEEAQKYLNTL